MLADRFAGQLDKMAAGLVGDGSECFGYDDDISQDHDWGAAVCIWLSRSDFEAFGEALQSELDALPKTFRGFPVRTGSTWGGRRTGVFEIGQFYRRFTGLDRLPRASQEWMGIPESNLAAATNGAVFTDGPGEFTRFREGLLAFYPPDIRLQKIAARCMKIAQAGQYNYPRCTGRGEFVAARVAEAEFIDAAISMVFLLNHAYKPFYKWMHRALIGLPILGPEMYTLLSDLACDEATPGVSAACGDRHREKVQLVEIACALIIKELRRQGLSGSTSDFLLDHGPAVQDKIEDPTIRTLGPWLDPSEH